MKELHRRIIPQIADVIKTSGWARTSIEPDRTRKDRAYICYKVGHRAASITMVVTAKGIELSKVVGEFRHLCRLRSRGNRIPGVKGLGLSIHRINSRLPIKARVCKGGVIQAVLEIKGKFNPDNFVAGLGAFIGGYDGVLRELLSD